MSKLGNKIKELRIKNGLSQDELAKSLGYSSRSTINKIEKGINEISYDKLMLLVNKFNFSTDDLFNRNSNHLFAPLKENTFLFISFSARENGHCVDIAKFLMNENDRLVLFKDIFYTPCSRCDYECFTNHCKYRHDDIYDLLNSSNMYSKIIFIVPMYCNNPSSLFFILAERMQDYFSHNEEHWNNFIHKLHFVCIYGSEDETPNFTDCFKRIIQNDERILSIQRHKHNQKIKDKIIENTDILNQLKIFKSYLDI